MVRGSVLMLALLFNAPLIWQALADQTVSAESAAVHFLITVPVVAVLLALLRAATSRPSRPGAHPRRPPASEPSPRDG
jgi:hypothetical protein